MSSDISESSTRTKLTISIIEESGFGGENKIFPLKNGKDSVVDLLEQSIELEVLLNCRSFNK